jgi:hypothetical protein
MSNTFKILAGFLERFEDEVEGRELEQPTEEIQTKLRDFARGKLRGPEQGEVIKLLSSNPQWVGRLAQEVKGLREGPVK